MSVRTITRVWEHSKHGGTELLMLLALADFADDHGNAYPAVSTLAEKCRMSSRNANHLLANLRASGELEIRMNEGPKGTNRYRIVLAGPEGLKRSSPPKAPKPLKPTSPLPPEASFTPEARFTLKPVADTPEAGSSKPLKPTSDEPSLNRQEPEREPAARASAADRGTRLPTDWSLPNEWQTWAQKERPDLDPASTAERFADHWRAQPGAKGRKADWLATWRNWVRNERGLSAGNRGRASPLHADDPFEGAI